MGPAGRVLTTAALATGYLLALVALGTAFWPLSLWFVLGYSVFLGIVLRHVWSPVQVSPEELPGAGKNQALGKRLPSWLALALGGALALGMASLLWNLLDDLQRYFAFAALVAALLGLVLARWHDF